MTLYVCIIFRKSVPLEKREVEAGNLPQAMDTAIALCLAHPTSTTYEIWQHGKKVHVGERVRLN
jgi:hypothetical protein